MYVYLVFIMSLPYVLSHYVFLFYLLCLCLLVFLLLLFWFYYDLFLLSSFWLCIFTRPLLRIVIMQFIRYHIILIMCSCFTCFVLYVYFYFLFLISVYFILGPVVVWSLVLDLFMSFFVAVWGPFPLVQGYQTVKSQTPLPSLLRPNHLAYNTINPTLK